MTELFEDALDHAVDAVLSRASIRFTDPGERERADRELWLRIEDLSFSRIGIEEEFGGSGGALSELVTALRASGRHQAQIPLAETNMAAWLCARVGFRLPSGSAAVIAPGDNGDLAVRDGRLDGVAHRVPWASQVEHIVALVSHERSRKGFALVCFPPSYAVIERGFDIADRPCDLVRVHDVVVEALGIEVTTEEIEIRWSLLRCALMLGALDAVLAMTLSYANERTQFGRRIGTNQSVQIHLVTLAQCVAVSHSALSQAVLADGSSTWVPMVQACSVVVSTKAQLAVKAAHQVHGAIGMTQEYPLQHFTRRLNELRLRRGVLGRFAHEIGSAACAGQDLRDIITGTWE